jgi:DNA-binding NarL/FixJ family response regulator
MSPLPKAAPEKSHPTKVFIVDDHPMLRQGIKVVVDQERDLTVCGDADSAADALAGIEKTKPDVVVLDLSLKNSNGLELIKDLHVRCPRLLILVLSMHDESFYAERALRAGARGYITKEEGTQMMVEGIRHVLRGEVFLSEKMSGKMLSKMFGNQTGREGAVEDRLSDREIEVLELLGKGFSTRQVAAQLHLSVKTIESHREHIKEKLRLNGANALIKYAVDWVRSRGGG